MSLKPASIHSSHPPTLQLPVTAIAGPSSPLPPATLHHEHHDIKVLSDGKVVETTTIEDTKVIPAPVDPPAEASGKKKNKKKNKGKGKAAAVADADEDGEEIIEVITTTVPAITGDPIATTTKTTITTHAHPPVTDPPLLPAGDHIGTTNPTIIAHTHPAVIDPPPILAPIPKAPSIAPVKNTQMDLND